MDQRPGDQHHNMIVYKSRSGRNREYDICDPGIVFENRQFRLNASVLDMGTFWGRIGGFDYVAVRRMLKKQPLLTQAVWGKSTPVSWLFVEERGVRYLCNWRHLHDTAGNDNKLPKMLRILLDAGCPVQTDASYCMVTKVCSYPFVTREVAERVFRMLLTQKDFTTALANFDYMKLKDKITKNCYWQVRHHLFGLDLVVDHCRFRQKLFINRLYEPKYPKDVVWYISTFI